MKKFANIFIVIASVLIFTGILFRNMHWPGASISLIVGINLSLLGTGRFKYPSLFKSEKALVLFEIIFYNYDDML